MNSSVTSLLTLAAFAAGTGSAFASLAAWQAQVGIGTVPAATVFTTTSGASPALVNVGSLSGDRSFEFIYNTPSGGVSQALLGSQALAAGAQGIKADQWQNSGVFGMTDFGVTDHYSPTSTIFNQDVHLVFTSDAVDTKMYLNGSLVYTFAGVDLTITGINALAAATNDTNTVFFDNLAGSVFGFASYDSALSPAEISTHYNAFSVPEPTMSGLACLTGLTALTRRRRK